MKITLYRKPARRAFTVLELLVAVSTIGIGAALLLPAIGAVRESARQLQCVSHMREIGIALHNHHDSLRGLPVGWRFDPAIQSGYGWVVPLLPFLEQSHLADRIDTRKPVDDPIHQQARNTSLPLMLCPSDIAEPMFSLFEETEGENEFESAMTGADARLNPHALVVLPTANYVGVFGTLDPDVSIPAPVGDGAFIENRTIHFRDFQRGLSGTIVVGERTMAQVPSTWFGIHLAGQDAAARLVGAALEGINNPLADECDFSSRHPGGANFLWGDGHIAFVAESIELQEYHQVAKLQTSADEP